MQLCTKMIQVSDYKMGQTHRELRRVYKKNRRKLKRQSAAQMRDAALKQEEHDKLKNPTYLTWLAEQGALELMREEQEEIERDENNRKWLERENLAQNEFRETQEKLLQIEVDKAKERIRLQLERDREEKRVEEIRLKRILLADERRRRHEMLMEKIDAYINENAEMPNELNETAETNPGKELCPFFIKTSSCRFGDRCSRNHVRPGISNLLLVPNFFNHIQLEQNKSTEYGCDTYLEYDNSELYNDFIEFFSDVTSELEKFGKLKHFIVSSNYEAHLRGNVFIEYAEQRDALKAYRSLRGRFYAGKRINVEFSTINSWKSAICGLSFSKKCPKGKTCNFLHPFKNPAKKFIVEFHKNGTQSVRLNGSNGDQVRIGSIRIDNLICQINSERKVQRTWNDEANVPNKRDWRWSESPEHSVNHTDRFTSKKSRVPSIDNLKCGSSFERAPSQRSDSRYNSRSGSSGRQNTDRHNSSSTRRRSTSRDSISDHRTKSSRVQRSERSDRKTSKRSRSLKRRKSSKKRNRSRSRSDSSSDYRKKAKTHKKSKKRDR